MCLCLSVCFISLSPRVSCPYLYFQSSIPIRSRSSQGVKKKNEFIKKKKTLAYFNLLRLFVFICVFCLSCQSRRVFHTSLFILPFPFRNQGFSQRLFLFCLPLFSQRLILFFHHCFFLPPLYLRVCFVFIFRCLGPMKVAKEETARAKAEGAAESAKALAENASRAAGEFCYWFLPHYFCLENRRDYA